MVFAAASTSHEHRLDVPRRPAVMRRGAIAAATLAALCGIAPAGEPEAAGSPAGDQRTSARRTSADWARADHETVRLDPAAFTELPSPLQLELRRRGCTVPQPAGSTSRRNVVRGHFTTAAQTDWAVLCSRQRTSAILVFAGGAAARARELAAEPDAQYLQVVGGDGTIGYSRVLYAVTPEAMRRRGLSEPGGRPAVMDHDGIEDAFEGKASVVWYWVRDRWIRLAGAD